MKSLTLPNAIKVCRDVGYAGVELALMPGYHAEPKSLTATDRKEIRTLLNDSKLALHGLMENLSEPANDTTHSANLDRLKAAAELGHTLSPDAPPPIETVLGGKPGDWEKSKDKLAERLAKWAEVGKSTKTVICVKPHVSNALHTPESAVWLLKQIASPWLQLAFDYSHFTLRKIKLADAITTLIPHTAFVHVKDAKGTAEKFEFLLPGEGDTDYAAYAKLLATAKYRGPVVVEVSGMVSNKPNYDAVAAAKQAFRALVTAFARGAKM
jgi:inosose dehydratase